jgi:GDP-mannose 6-dehydrogenase
MGYVGCVTAACLSRDGYQVVGVDVDPAKVAELNAGQVPIVEPGLAEIVAAQVANGRLRATTDVAEAVGGSELALISVGTPSAEDGSISTDALERVIKSIGANLKGTSRSYTIVVRSTLLPGMLEERLAPLLAEAAGRPVGGDLTLCNNPEFLRESSAIADYDRPPFIVVGAESAETAQPVFDLYRGIESKQILCDTRTAALAKYACNAFHALKVAFANEIGSFAKALGADGQRVMSIICEDRKLNISPAYLRPGFAFGGSCLPKDVRAIIRCVEQFGLSLDVLKAVIPSNDAHIRRGVQAIQRTGHRKIGLIGLSFKAGTDDLRESPLVILIETLLGRGFDIRIYDPNVAVTRLRGRNLAYVDRHLPHLAALLVDGPEQLYAHASLLVLGTDVADEVDWKAAYAGPTLDLRRDICGQPAHEKSRAESGPLQANR